MRRLAFEIIGKSAHSRKPGEKKENENENGQSLRWRMHSDCTKINQFTKSISKTRLPQNTLRNISQRALSERVSLRVRSEQYM
jgi:hypothetical protein